MTINARVDFKKQLAAAIESTEGTAETLGDSDAGFMPIDLNFSDDLEFIERAFHQQTLSKLKDIPGAYPCAITFKHRLMGSGAAGVAPPWGILMKACGWKETIVTDTSVTYTLSSTQSDWKTLTIGVWQDGILSIARGCAGNVKINLEAGMPAEAEFSFLGVFSSEADASAYDPTLPTQLPQIWQSATLTFDASAAGTKLKTLTFDPQCEIVPRADPNAVYGILHFMKVDRSPMVTIDPEMVLRAVYNWQAKMLAATTIDVDFVLGSGTGNTMTWAIPACQIISNKKADRDKLMTRDIQMRATGTDDDEVSIVIT